MEDGRLLAVEYKGAHLAEGREWLPTDEGLLKKPPSQMGRSDAPDEVFSTTPSSGE